MTFPEAPIPLTDGRFTLPGNRWDLLAAVAAGTPSVAVIIPYYNQQHDLDLVLHALELQDYPLDAITVVVADDGSTQAPTLRAPRLRVEVVRQADRGFRAAAARNLGVSHSAADILCFLDADTVPEPGYLRNITRLPALAPDVLVVGHRRHAELDDWTPADLPDWWSGRRAPRVLDEPQWLSDEYRRSSDLLRIDHRSYRYLISSVMCCSRTLFESVGGFDETFCHYGGEDWEFAHRALAGGALLHHARDALAWHNGPDWAGRVTEDRVAGKNIEALALARRITDPDARTTGLRYELPDIAVRIPADEHTAGSLVATMSCFLHEDVGIWVNGPEAERLLRDAGTEDQRIRSGPIPDSVLQRCRFVVDTAGRPVLPRSSFTELVRRCGEPDVESVAVTTPGAHLGCRSSWSANRARRWSDGDVRFCDPADAQRLGHSLAIAADQVRLVCGDSAPDLSW
ncbi:glycosyltransferase [Mycolicibacterium mengxianglii]|uniref:glycosyltransferase n=1 Tax=Mycolicibacterium mengxianglii TaxID=2736649 RepID=UPI0027DA51F3|nr:glycosyltransferase [Mycolicibacterium mengxianglii]